MEVYLYGFARPEPTRNFSYPGLEEIGPARPVELGGLAAIVSSIPPGAIESGLTCQPPDPDWIVPRALHHERVVEAVQASAPVLPVRFGCVFSSPEALQAVADQHRQPIEQFLHEVTDQEEWSLKAYLDADAAVETLLVTNPLLSERYRKLPTAPGTRYFLEKRLREDARDEARRGGRAAVEKLHRALLATGFRVQIQKVQEGEGRGRDLLLKTALLIPRVRIDEMFANAEMTAASAGPVPLSVERSGPWPPYHFCPNLGEPAR
ncbi:MAG: GvpL/GvpF family gas vesicle protein [Isosphaeraceae bacterium]